MGITGRRKSSNGSSAAARQEWRRFVKFMAWVRPLWVGICLVGGSASAYAQDLDRNKTPGQLFSSNCTACHRSAQGLAKNLGASGLPSFLRQHYTTGPAMAASLAGFLVAAGDAPPSRPGRAAAKPADAQAEEGRRPDETPKQRRAREATAAKDAASAAAAAQVRQRQPGEPATVSSDPEPITIAIAPMPVPQDENPRPGRMAPPAVPAYVVLPSTPPVRTDNAIPAAAPSSAVPTPAAPSPAATEPSATRTAAVPTATSAPVAGTPEPGTPLSEAAASAAVPQGPDAAAQAVADQSGFTAPLP
jgi:hypothetical protein